MPKVTMPSEESENPTSIEPISEIVIEPEDELEYEPRDENEEENQNIKVEDLDPETILWEDGPTAGQIVEWKAEYGEVYLTNITFDKHVVWRPIFRPEYASVVRRVEEAISNGMSQSEATMFNEEIVCEIACLMPKFELKDFNKELAGLPSSISQQVLDASGFNPIDLRRL